ncbi:SH3 domain-binding glutamic acid-rich-like protein 3 [Hyperolius riggenbachi]|uniref:SH3 domain-binding glutamic acid-rich-like protein 3 n=1 Tax=Hyperolius riggenbachi TaxID=752182 RepID=UPI0035A37D68
MCDSLRMFMTSVTSSRETKAHQAEMTRILDTCGHPYETVDISVDSNLRAEMREKSGNPSALPPLLFRGDKFIGGIEELKSAVEDSNLEELLQGKN